MDQTLSNGMIQREDQPAWEQMTIDMSKTNTNVFTPLIIPRYLYDAHSSLFPKEWLSIKNVYTLVTMQNELKFDNAHSWLI